MSTATPTTHTSKSMHARIRQLGQLNCPFSTLGQLKICCAWQVVVRISCPSQHPLSMPCCCSRRWPVFGPGCCAVRPRPGAESKQFCAEPWGSRLSVRLSVCLSVCPSVRPSPDLVARRSATRYPVKGRMTGSYKYCARPT